MEFYQMVKNCEVEHVEFVKKNSHINVFLKKEALEHNSAYEEVKNNTTGPQYFLVVTDLQVYNENLRDMKNQFVQERVAADSTLVANEIAKEYDVPMKQDNSQNWGFEILLWTFPLLLIFLLYFFSMRQMRGGGPLGGAGNIFNIGKSRAQEFDEKTSQVVTFKDVAGLDGATFVDLALPHARDRRDALLPKPVRKIHERKRGKRMVEAVRPRDRRRLERPGRRSTTTRRP